MILQAFDRRIYLLAAGLVWSSCAPNASLATAAPGPQRVPVAEVQRILANDRGEPDAKVAQELSGLELTERMSYAQLQSFEQSVPGTKSRQALVALADASVFLGPAAADVLPEAPPDLSEQRRMIALLMEYLNKTLPKLPNFYATRTTVRYAYLRNAKTKSYWRKVGSARVVVTYRDGKEVINPREWSKRASHPEEDGLVTRGVFGPILSTVILDAARSEMSWGRWERGDGGTLAVFRYRVPRKQSHYALAFHALSSDKGEASRITGYLGEVAIDPATGTILRMTVLADVGLDSPILRGDIMVEYGPVEIGGKTYPCPIRSVSISLTNDQFPDPLAQTGQTNLLLNDVLFANYHEFRSESRILPGITVAPHP